MIVKANSVLHSNVRAKCSYITPERGTIFICETLTVETARAVIAAASVGVISQKGNFACHAANLLRAERSKGRQLAWLTGLKIAEAAWAEILSDGICVFPDEALVQITSNPQSATDLYAFEPGHSSWSEVCIWPERVYGEEEHGLMRIGLEACATELAVSPVTVTLSGHRLWFSAPALDSTAILAFASTRSTSIPYLERMERDYDWIWHDLGSTMFSPDTPDRFFGTLIPFHRTYGTVLQGIASELTDDGSLLDTVLTNDVVQWLESRPEFSTSRKIQGDQSWNGLIPPYPPGVYVNRLESRLRASTTAELSDETIHWLALIAVIKEFKMIIAKNLYAKLPAL